jgi:hypothetical protein
LRYFVPALNSDQRPIVEGPATSNGTPPFFNGPPMPSLIALDAAKFHKTPAVLRCLHSWDIISSLTPGGCADLIQSLDVSVNGPFKNILHDVLELEMDNLGKNASDQFDVETESTVGERRILMTECVGRLGNG